MFAPTFASFIAPASLPGLSPRHPSQVSPAAQERHPASNPPRLATVAGTMALSTTEFRDDTALSQRQLDLASDHLALHLFTTHILATAQRMSATDGSEFAAMADAVIRRGFDEKDWKKSPIQRGYIEAMFARVPGSPSGPAASWQLLCPKLHRHAKPESIHEIQKTTIVRLLCRGGRHWIGCHDAATKRRTAGLP